MSVAITVRNVPDEVRDELAARAARTGQSLQEYLSAQLIRLAATPSVTEALARARINARSYPALSAEDVRAAIEADRR